MTTRQEQKNRMAAAATARTAPESGPAGRTAIRTKPVRITIDLDPADYRDLKRWIDAAAAEINPDWPDLTLMQAVRAMIHATINDDVVNGVVLDLLRREQA